MKELKKARDKHPVFPIEPTAVVAIVTEEVGEAAKEAVELTWARKDDPTNLYTELAQTAVTCIRGISSVSMAYLNGMSPIKPMQCDETKSAQPFPFQ
jgi:hypothetical protein